MQQLDLPSITIIVCTRDRPVLLEQCLSALSKQTYPYRDVLVVDNASVRPVQTICQRWGAAYSVAPVPGLTRARNIGASQAHGELIAFIDDDAVAEAGWLEALVEDFTGPDVAAVTGTVRFMLAQNDSRAMSEEAAPGNVVRDWRSFDRDTADWFTLACFGGIGRGGNMAFRKSALANVHGFDERIGRGRLVDGGDEHAIFVSLIASGYRITHNPKAIVRHPSPPTLELQRIRSFNSLRSAIAFLLYAWGEFPAHRNDILRFLSRAVRKRVIAGGAKQTAAIDLSRLQKLKAMINGVSVYWRARKSGALTGSLRS